MGARACARWRPPRGAPSGRGKEHAPGVARGAHSAVAVLAAVALGAAGAGAKGDEHVLVILASAGSKPYSVAEVQRTVSQANAFFEISSFGQVRLRVDVTPWLPELATSSSCGLSTRGLDAVVAPARQAADRAGFNPDLYDDVVYTLADSHCG